MPPEMAGCPSCGRERLLSEMPACEGRCGRRFCGDCLDRAYTCLSCAAHASAPRDPQAGAPPLDPDELAGRILARDDLANLIRLAADLSPWSETLDTGECCDDATLADIEALGTRAHDIMRRLRAEEVASS